MTLVVGDTVDSFHSWDKAQPSWTETFWYGAWIPEIATTVYIYQWFRPAVGIYGGGCMVWNSDDHLPWDVPVFYYDVNRPLAAPADLSALVLDSGTTLKTVVEGDTYDIGFKRGDVEVALRFAAVTPPVIVTAKGMSDFFNGHIDQAGRYTGHLTLSGKRHAIDCFGIRDRSWGPRVIGDAIRMNYCHGQSQDLAFVCYSKPDKGEDTIFKGYLALDGKRLELTGGKRRAHYRDGVLQSVAIELRDSAGRTREGVGVALNRFIYEPFTGLITWLHLMKWTFGDQVIYGEEQDVWSMALWRKRDRHDRS